MRRYEREVIDKDSICKILDMIDTIHIGMFDDTYPYVVPVNFGYSYRDKLTFYFHCAREGKKLDLLAKNPNVCVEASRFLNFPDRPYKQHIHDFRSVIAFGTFSIIDQKTNTAEFGKALQLILKHNNRGPNQFDPTRVPLIYVCKIECAPENVSAKSEFPVRTPDDVPFADVYNLPGDNEPTDITELLDRPH